MRQLRNYYGPNQELKTIINDFNHHIGVFERSTNNTVKRKVIPIMEAYLISIVPKIDNSGSEEDKIWLAGNRLEINQLLTWLTKQRKYLGIERDTEPQKYYNDVKQRFSNINRIYESRDAPNLKRNSSAIQAGFWSLTAGAVGIVATGASAGSFVAGPLVGGVTVASTGGVGLFATAGAGITGAVYGALKADQEIESAIRNHSVFRPNT